MYLVTGVPGWLGTHFLKALCGKISELKELSPINEKDDVRCLVQPGMDTSIIENIDQRVRVFEGDVTVLDSLREFFDGSKGATLFHLVGIIHPTRGIKQIFDVNVKGTENVLVTAIQNNVKRIIAISSNSPVGVNPRKDHLFTEESPVNPYLAYGRSKMIMEKIVNQAYMENKIESVLLRPCWFYGPGQPERQSLFFTMIKNGKVPIVGSGENKRSMSYIENICQAMLLAAVSNKANGQTYWIADENPYTMNEIIDTVEKILETEFNYKVFHKRLKLPNFASTVAYIIDWMLQKFGLYHQKIHVLSEMNKTIACSIQKAQDELNYNPKVDLEEGMKRSIKWALDAGHVI